MIFQDLKPSNIAVNEDCELKVIYGPGPEVVKLFSCSDEHEIYPAHKC